MTDQNCPNCGADMGQAQKNTFSKEGDSYCCRGCAEGTGCTCH
jgi:hypothetical protein